MSLTFNALFIPLILSGYTPSQLTSSTTGLYNGTTQAAVTTAYGTPNQITAFQVGQPNGLMTARYNLGANLKSYTDMSTLVDKSMIIPYNFNIGANLTPEGTKYIMSNLYYNFKSSSGNMYNVKNGLTFTWYFYESSSLIVADVSNFNFRYHNERRVLRDELKLYFSLSYTYFLDDNTPSVASYQYTCDLDNVFNENGSYLIANAPENNGQVYIHMPYDRPTIDFKISVGLMANSTSEYEHGYSIGYANGNVNGYQQALDDHNINVGLGTPLGIVKNLFGSMTDLLSIEIFPNFTIGTAVTLPLIAGAFFLILKILKG